jgi:DNA-directed RNA polymerase specialized sigma24 family protein
MMDRLIKNCLFFIIPGYYSFLIHLLIAKESAEEIVSDVFLKIWLRRKSISEIENLHLYLYISTKNLSINAVLKTKREKTFFFRRSEGGV